MNGQLSDLMLEICEDEFSKYGEMPEHRFSFRFRRKMDKLIKSQYAPKPASVRCMKYAIIALVTAVVVLTGFIVTDIVFPKSDNNLLNFTFLNARYSGTAPETILNYYQPKVPDRFVKNEELSYCTDKYNTVYFTNGETGFSFSQSVISEFSLGVERDKAVVEYTYGEDGFTIRYSGGKIIDTVWCDGVYVYHLSAVEADKNMLDLKNLQEFFPKEIKTAEEIFSEIM